MRSAVICAMSLQSTNRFRLKILEELFEGISNYRRNLPLLVLDQAQWSHRLLQGYTPYHPLCELHPIFEQFNNYFRTYHCIY